MSRQRTILVLAVASQAAFSMITFGLPAIGVEIRERFDLGPAGFGAVFAAVGIGSAAALIPAGALVDRFGGRRILVIGGVVNGAGLILAAFAGSAPAYAAALVLAGIGGAAVPVAGMTALLRVFEPEKRGMAMGWRQLGVPLGGTIGSAVLPALAALGGVRLAMQAPGSPRRPPPSSLRPSPTVGPPRTADRLGRPSPASFGSPGSSRFWPSASSTSSAWARSSPTTSARCATPASPTPRRRPASRRSTSRPRSHDSSGGGWPTAAAAPGGPGRCATSAS